MYFFNARRFLTAFGVVLVLSGCAAMKSHDELTDQMQAAQKTGGVSAALKTLEASATSDDQKAAMLYNMERGELLRLDRKYDDSTRLSCWLTSKSRSGKRLPKPIPKGCCRLLAPPPSANA